MEVVDRQGTRLQSDDSNAAAADGKQGQASACQPAFCAPALTSRDDTSSVSMRLAESNRWWVKRVHRSRSGAGGRWGAWSGRAETVSNAGVWGKRLCESKTRSPTTTGTAGRCTVL